MKQIDFPTSVFVTEQEIDLSTLSEQQKQYYRNLAERFFELYKNAGAKRLVIGIGGASGSGKSVTAEILRILISQLQSEFTVYTADIDAFHYRNEHLHNTEGLDGMKLHTVKGRHDTYDTGSLAHKLGEFVSGKNVAFPSYSRKVHEPIQDCYVPHKENALMILAGLWLLYDHPAWASVREHVRYTFMIQGNPERMRHHTITRHIRGGKSKEEAELFYATSDHMNLQELEKNSIEPDEIVLHHEDV